MARSLKDSSKGYKKPYSISMYQDTMLRIAKAAHDKDMTVSELVADVMTKWVEKRERFLEMKKSKKG